MRVILLILAYGAITLAIMLKLGTYLDSLSSTTSVLVGMGAGVVSATLAVATDCLIEINK